MTIENPKDSEELLQRLSPKQKEEINELIKKLKSSNLKNKADVAFNCGLQVRSILRSIGVDQIDHNWPLLDLGQQTNFNKKILFQYALEGKSLDQAVAFLTDQIEKMSSKS